LFPFALFFFFFFFFFLGFERAHFDIRRGTQREALDYVTKRDTRVDGPWFHGEPREQVFEPPFWAHENRAMHRWMGLRELGLREMPRVGFVRPIPLRFDHDDFPVYTMASDSVFIGPPSP